MRRTQGALAIAVAFVCGVLVRPALASEEWVYFVEDGRVVITNVPSRPDVRPVPGFEKRVAEALRGDLPATPWDRTIEVLASRHGLPVPLIKAVALVESNLDPSAVSPKGAMGLMQLMPATAAQYGVRNPFDPEQSLAGGTRFLADLLDDFDGDVNLALAAYNAGPGAVRRWGGVPGYRETRDYVRKVRSRLGEAPGAPRTRRTPPPGDDGEIRVRTRPDGTIVFSN